MPPPFEDQREWKYSQQHNENEEDARQEVRASVWKQYAYKIWDSETGKMSTAGTGAGVTTLSSKGTVANWLQHPSSHISLMKFHTTRVFVSLCTRAAWGRGSLGFGPLSMGLAVMVMIWLCLTSVCGGFEPEAQNNAQLNQWCQIHDRFCVMQNNHSIMYYQARSNLWRLSQVCLIQSTRRVTNLP